MRIEHEWLSIGAGLHYLMIHRTRKIIRHKNPQIITSSNLGLLVRILLALKILTKRIGFIKRIKTPKRSFIGIRGQLQSEASLQI